MTTKRDAVRETFYDPVLSPGRSNNQAENQFNDLYRFYVRRLTELCVNRFKWEGLPSSVDPRFLEMTIHQGGLSVFYFDERYERFMALRGNSAGRWNMYDNPTGFQVTGNAFVNRYVSANDAVPIWGNATRTPDLDTVAIFARDLADLTRTIEINTQNARRNKVIAVPENQRLSAQAYVDQINRGDPVIFVNSAAMVGDKPINELVQTIDLGIHPDHLVNLHIMKMRLWSEAMGHLGIDNSNQDKKERLVQAEVSANDGQTENQRRIALNAREYACEQINARWPGLDVSVGFHVDDAPTEDPAIEGELEDDEDNSGSEAISGNFHRRALQGR